MESIIVGAIAEGLKSGRLPAWIILPIGIVWVLSRVAKPITSAAIAGVAHVARIERIGMDLAESLKELARGNATEHERTRDAVGKVGSQVIAIEASLRTTIDGLERTVLDSRTSRAVEKLGELAAAVEASVDEAPPVEVPVHPPRRARAPSRPG